MKPKPKFKIGDTVKVINAGFRNPPLPPAEGEIVFITNDNGIFEYGLKHKIPSLNSWNKNSLPAGRKQYDSDKSFNENFCLLYGDELNKTSKFKEGDVVSVDSGKVPYKVIRVNEQDGEFKYLLDVLYHDNIDKLYHDRVITVIEESLSKMELPSSKFKLGEEVIYKTTVNDASIKCRLVGFFKNPEYALVNVKFNIPHLTYNINKFASELASCDLGFFDNCIKVPVKQITSAYSNKTVYKPDQSITMGNNQNKLKYKLGDSVKINVDVIGFPCADPEKITGSSFFKISAIINSPGPFKYAVEVPIASDKKDKKIPGLISSGKDLEEFLGDNKNLTYSNSSENHYPIGEEEILGPGPDYRYTNDNNVNYKIGDWVELACNKLGEPYTNADEFSFTDSKIKPFMVESVNNNNVTVSSIAPNLIYSVNNNMIIRTISNPITYVADTDNNIGSFTINDALGQTKPSTEEDVKDPQVGDWVLLPVSKDNVPHIQGAIAPKVGIGLFQVKKFFINNVLGTQYKRKSKSSSEEIVATTYFNKTDILKNLGPTHNINPEKIQHKIGDYVFAYQGSNLLCGKIVGIAPGGFVGTYEIAYLKEHPKNVINCPKFSDCLVTDPNYTGDVIVINSKQIISKESARDLIATSALSRSMTESNLNSDSFPVNHWATSTTSDVKLSNPKPVEPKQSEASKDGVEGFKPINLTGFKFIKDQNELSQVEKKEENQMSDNNGFVSMVKDDAVEASYRVGANQMSKATRAAIVKALKQSGAKRSQIKAVTELLDSEAGLAGITLALGMLLTYFPAVKEKPQAQRLAKEFRVGGMALGGNLLADSVFQTILPVVLSQLENLPDPGKVRVATEALTEKTKVETVPAEEEVEEEVLTAEKTPNRRK